MTLEQSQEALKSAEHGSIASSMYKTKRNGSNISLELRFGPLGVAVASDAFTDKQPVTGIQGQAGSFTHTLNTDNNLIGVNLLLFSGLTAMAQSGAPIDASAVLIISGGVQDKSFPLKMPLDNVGEAVMFLFDITFY